MIITCPACDRKYYVDPLKVKEGKKVRCTVCETTWFFKPEEEILILSDHTQAGYLSQQATEKEQGNGKIFWLFNLFLLGFIFSGAFIFRDYIATNFPFTKIAYEYLNIDYKLTRDSLLIDNVSYVQDNGIFKLTGVVKNLSQKDVEIPLIFITIIPEDKSLKPMIFSYKLPQNFLRKKEVVKFISSSYQVPYKNFTMKLELKRE